MTLKFTPKTQLYIIGAITLAWTVPFVVLLIVMFYPTQQSLSGIGWRHGGMYLLAPYTFLMGMAMMYAMWIFQKLLGRRSKALIILMSIGCLLVIAGVFVPVRAHELGGINTFFHDRMAQLGSAICVVAGIYMMGMLIHDCKTHVKRVVGTCVVVAVTMFTCLYFFGFAALAQVTASHLVFAAIFYMCFTIRNGKLVTRENPNR